MTQRMILSAFILFGMMFGNIKNGKGGSAKKGPSLKGATGWFNTHQLSLENLRGKVVLIDFWTYTCINWRRTLPYIREWDKKYRDHGLVVIGVHTPEFSFEYKEANVAKAIKEMKIDYPVAVDNDYKIWNSFRNQYWPALYLIDSKGVIRYQKFGEEDYVGSELWIQQLLKEVSNKNSFNGQTTLQTDGYELAADWNNLASPETFLGYYRSQGFASPGGVVRDQPNVYLLPDRLNLNSWALSGEWIIGSEGVRLDRGTGTIVYRFHARDLHLIMGPQKEGTTIKFRVLIDGRPPGTAHGLDVDGDGNGKVTHEGMYQLIRQKGLIDDHELQIQFLDPGVQVFDFTFG